MAFSFTLPELRAELRALGHDGLPDHLILSFLSQLHLPLPSPAPPSDSSGYDTEASTCSTHSLSCGYGSSSKECSLSGERAGVRALEGCAESLSPSPRVKKALSGLGHYGPDDPALCAKPSSLPKTECAADFGDGRSHKMAACRLGEGFWGDGNTTRRRSSSELHSENSELPSSRISVEREQSLNRGKGAEMILNENNVAKIVDLARGDLGESRDASVGQARTTGSRTSRSHQADQRTEHGEQENTDNIIEHYWISVGKEHMRAMHSKLSKEKEQLKEPSRLASHGDANTSNNESIESKNGCESLIAKVQRCENELQGLTLSLQAQQCKKPWFLEAARKPRVCHKGKHDISTNSGLSDPMPASDSTVKNVEGCGNLSLQGQPSIVMGNRTEMIVDTDVKASENRCFSSLEHADNCLKAQTMSVDLSQHMLLSKVDEGDTMKKNVAVILSVGDVGEVCQIEDTESKDLLEIPEAMAHSSCPFAHLQENDNNTRKEEARLIESQGLLKCKGYGRKTLFLLLMKLEAREREYKVFTTFSPPCIVAPHVNLKLVCCLRNLKALATSKIMQQAKQLPFYFFSQ